MTSKVLRSGTKFYSYVYLVLGVLTPIYVLGTFIVAFIMKTDATQVPGPIYISGGRLFFGSIAFFVWWQIFKKLSEWFYSERSELETLTRISKLLVLAFVLEVIETVLSTHPALAQQATDWSQITFPSGKGHWAQVLFAWFQWLLKVSATMGFFITPRTTGLSTLLLAGVFFILAESKKVRA